MVFGCQTDLHISLGVYVLLIGRFYDFVSQSSEGWFIQWVQKASDGFQFGNIIENIWLCAGFPGAG